MNGFEMLKELKNKGVLFEEKLSGCEMRRIEALYGFKFPNSLKAFYRDGVPYSEGEGEAFPRWRDFSEQNVKNIKARMTAPLKWLKRDIENGFWIEKWGERPNDSQELSRRIEELLALSPVLIPIYSHRYTFLSDEPNVPVISTVGRDTIYYGRNLEEYLRHEFLGENASGGAMHIPLWSDIIEHNEREFAKNEALRREFERQTI